MGNWEDKLVEDLKAEVERRSAGAKGGADDPLTTAWSDVVRRFDEAISRVGESAGLVVEMKDGEDRRRWTVGQHILTVRTDRVAGKLFLTVDLGRDLVMEEITALGSQLVDTRSRPVTADELAQRFVTLFFRGS